MEAQIAQFANRGMNQDISVSKASNEFAFRNYNIRITAVNDNTLLSVTNEKLPLKTPLVEAEDNLIPNRIYIGYNCLQAEYEVASPVSLKITFRYPDTTKETLYYTIPKGFKVFNVNFNASYVVECVINHPKYDDTYRYYTDYENESYVINDSNFELKGIYLGNGIIGDSIVIFTTGDKDRIYELTYNTNKFDSKLLYEGILNFDENHLIETLPYYESEDIQKIYWVDGINNTRFINIKGYINEENDNQFDFNPAVEKFPSVSISKAYNGSGLFPSGVIQYFISYYNKFGTETGIVWSSDLHYISEKTKGEAADKSVVCNFNLHITNIDPSFDYIRVYSAIRTSIDGEPIVSIVSDTPINSNTTLKLADYNTNNEIIDPTTLLFLGGNNIIASTLTQKDDVLFLGNLKIKETIIPEEILKEIELHIETSNDIKCFRGISFGTKNIETTEKYNYQLNKSSNNISTFKKGEFYRFAIQFQDFTGNWTAPVFLGDKKCEITPTVNNNVFTVADLNVTLNYNLRQLLQKYYSNYRILMAETSNSTRSILAQGIVTPTVFNHAERVNNSGPYSIASWLMRPRKGNAQFEHLAGLGSIKQGDVFNNTPTCEIQNSLEANPTINKSNGSDLTNNFYVDSSILNFYSPELNNNEDLFKDTSLKFRIVGVVPISDTTSDILLETKTQGKYAGAGLIKNATKVYNTVRTTRDRVPSEPSDETNSDTTLNDVFIRRAVYIDTLLSKEGNFISNATSVSTAKYFIHLWHKKGSIIGQTSNSKQQVGDNEENIDTIYSELKHKIIANKRKCDNIIYINDNNILNYNINPTVFDSNEIESKALKIINDSVIYQGNYENLLTVRPESDDTDFSYRVFFTDPATIETAGHRPSGSSGSTSSNRLSYNHTDLKQYDPVSIKYKTTKHLVFSLQTNKNNEYKILPYLSANNEKAWDIKDLYEGFNFPDTIKYPWFKNEEYYSQDVINNVTTDNYPYFFIGEIYRNVTVDSIYGGYDNNSLQKINWLPISNPTPLNENVTLTSGDTYFQRWDCLAAYPFTEEDMNSVVDITSFLVETHINLDGRYDLNKEINNILTVRPTNSNLINEVYTQKNNYFNYNILDTKFNQTDYFNQITYSLQKTITSNIDVWCNITLASSFNINGSYDKLNKLINFNDSIIAFQDKAISVINFNNHTALSTETGAPIEIANSGKVNGYSVITSTTGCQNKWSICDASSGLYFIDDYNKTLMRFNKEGLNNVSSNGLSIWFKDNLTGKERVFTDYINGDVYIINKDNCVVYNEALQSFTSFMDYTDIDCLFNLKDKPFILKNNIVYTMFEGEYTSDYSIEYKVNPEMYSDKTFTNIEYSADCLPFYKPIDSIPRDKRFNKPNLPFDRLEVWNEYQYGITDIKDRFKYPNFESKFRKWRVDIPRDVHSKNKLGKFRNPWVYLKLSNSTNHTDKMVFHNLLVKYYK